MRYRVTLASGGEMVVDAARVSTEDSGVLRFWDEQGVFVAMFGRNQWVCCFKASR